jgi:hypothetical protein
MSPPSMTADPTCSAMTYYDVCTRTWHYRPTDPDARHWRGAYPTREHMRRAMITELGSQPAENETHVRPEPLG